VKPVSAQLTQDNFIKAQRALDGILDDAKQKAADVGLQVALQRVPRSEPARPASEDRPPLHETIEILHEGEAVVLKAGAPEENVNHAGFQEFGTRRNKSTPYMGPATEAMRIAYPAEAEKAVKARLAR
jgi:hypothetical protein